MVPQLTASWNEAGWFDVPRLRRDAPQPRRDVPQFRRDVPQLRRDVPLSPSVSAPRLSDLSRRCQSARAPSWREKSSTRVVVADDGDNSAAENSNPSWNTLPPHDVFSEISVCNPVLAVPLVAKVFVGPLFFASMSSSSMAMSSQASLSVPDVPLAAVALSRPLLLARKVLLAAVVFASPFYFVPKVPPPTYAWIESLR